MFDKRLQVSGFCNFQNLSYPFGALLLELVSNSAQIKGSRSPELNLFTNE